MANISLSYHMITWGGDAFIQFLDDIHELGTFRGVETFPHLVERYEGREEEFDAELKKRNLQLVCFYGGGNLWDKETEQKEIDHNLKLIRFLHNHGGERLVLGPGGKPKNFTPKENDYKRIAENMNKIGEAALSKGIKAGIHPHLGTVIESRKEIDLIMSLTDPRYVFFAPDPAHLKGAGLDPAEVISDFADRVVYMHIKDLTPEEKRKASVDVTTGTEALPIFCELGQGVVDLVGVVNVLRRANYKGWITVELDETRRTPRESAEISLKYLKEVLHLPE
jgi:inosose dehydratase